jgi:hypothetical protein
VRVPWSEPWPRSSSPPSSFWPSTPSTKMRNPNPG